MCGTEGRTLTRQLSWRLPLVSRPLEPVQLDRMPVPLPVELLLEVMLLEPVPLLVEMPLEPVPGSCWSWSRRRWSWCRRR